MDQISNMLCKLLAANPVYLFIVYSNIYINQLYGDQLAACWGGVCVFEHYKIISYDSLPL